MTTFNDEMVTLIYENCNFADRTNLQLCVEALSLAEPYMSLNSLKFIYELHYIGTDTERYARTLMALWGCIPADVPIPGGTLVRWNVDVPHINTLAALVASGDVDQCMPYGDLVNFRNIPLQVPDPSC